MSEPKSLPSLKNLSNPKILPNTKKLNDIDSLNEEAISRVIEMAWEDRTPFEAIEHQFGLNQDGVIKLMRRTLLLRSFKLWRKRTHGQKTKHLSLRETQINRHQSKQHNKLHR